VTGPGTLNCQWQESTDGGITWNNLAENTSNAANPATGIYTGTTTSVLTISNVPSGMNGNKYQISSPMDPVVYYLKVSSNTGFSKVVPFVRN